MKICVIFFFLSLSSFIYGQGEDDHVNWSFNKFSFNIDEQWKMDITPIVRLNNNISNFSNASIDISINRSIGHGLSAGIVFRSWYFPGRKLRQFIWLDLVHKLPDIGIPFNIKQRLRWHGELDIYDWKDGDFLRYHLGFLGTFKNSKIQPFFAIEPFYQFNRLNYIERFRIEYGFHLKASKNLKFIAFMRQQEMYNFEETYTQFLWTTGIQYTFDNKIINGSKTTVN